MNLRGISFYLSFFCFPISFLAFINILYASYFDYFLSIDTYFIALFISLFAGLTLFYYGKNSKKKISFFDQLMLVITAYLITSFLIAIPFYLSNYQVTFLNSIFESISGLTGTGFSIFKNIKYLDPTLVLWRSSSQWIGGLFFLFFLIIIFSNKSFNYKMTNLSYSEENNINSKSNIKDNLLRILIIYSVLSILILFLLSFSGVRLFNSLNLSMTLISGGGFLPTDSIDKIISTNFQKIVFIFSLLVSMLNFYLLFNLFNRNILIKEHREDLNLIILSLTLCVLIYFNDYQGLDIIINVISSLANSGLTFVKSENNLSLYFLLITIIGGSLISNTSGIKLTRFYILLKITSSEIIKLISPNSIINKSIFNSDNKISDDDIKISFLIFISFFLGLFILSSLLVIDDIGFEKSFKLSILTLTNTFNSEMYDMQNINFSNLLTSSKISLILFMIIGKIELISIFLIFKKVLLKD
jgi:trk system potassium uptake protein TrkH